MKSFFGKKAVKIVISVFVAVFTIVAVCNGVFAYVGLKEQYGVAQCDEWNPTDSFRVEDVQKMDMGKDDFKILCLTDIHIRNHATFGAPLGVNLVLDAAGRVQIKKLINKQQPDLIVITGDTVLTAWNDISLKNFADFMDSFEIPWAHVYGNHDTEGRADKAKLSEILLESKNGLFECGPDGMNGMGNYILNLERNGKTSYSLFFMDDGEYRVSEGERSDGGVGERQIQWYQWAMNGINNANGASVPNMAFFHVPVPEYKMVENEYAQGQRGEDSFTAKTNDGFFNSFKEMGGTHMFAGHDHSNNFVASYQGVTLAYATKSSYNCYFTSKALGGTLITIKPDNTVMVENKSF